MLNKSQLSKPEEGFIYISISKQVLYCYHRQKCIASYMISSGKNGVGEQENSGCTPRGRHEVTEIIGLEHEINSVFVGRVWTGEIYSKELRKKFNDRDWILTRIIRLSGLEKGFNLGGSVDTYNRYIYIHGAPDDEPMGVPGSHGCIRMRNQEVIEIANWVKKGMSVLIDESFRLPFKDVYPEELNIWSKES
jgi:L,D-transpeptidase catalytic domain